MKVTMVGSGAWGTAVSKLLHENGHSVILWSHDPAELEDIQRWHENKTFLPGIPIPEGWRYEPDLTKAVHDGDLIIIAVPSRVMRSIAQRISGYSGSVVSVTKGIEYESGLTMSGVLHDTLPAAKVSALSGPSLAMEVARGIPTAIVAASQDTALAVTVQQLFHRPRFRVYTSTDIEGVELGGALKNVVALAAGVGDGLGFGDNSKAALITRGIVEIRRLGVACGAKPETFSGLSGLGDLTVTCFSKLSRNRTFGEKIGRGENIDELLKKSVSIVEGHPTARSAHHLAQRLGVSTPIIDEVHALLYHGKDPAQAVADLTRRESKAETEPDGIPPAG